MGVSIVGGFIFFIPREWWPSKPIGSGATIAHDLNYSFSNISCPYIAEGYVNFSVFGVISFMFFLGFVIAIADRVYWVYSAGMDNSWFRVLYYLLFGILFFVLRGDLMSSFAYSIGIVLSSYFVFSFVFGQEKLRFKAHCRRATH